MSSIPFQGSPINLTYLLEGGQSIWLDNLSRTLIEDGGLKEMIEFGVRGVTTNPSIFHKSITESSAYDAAILALSEKELSDEELTEKLMIEDVQKAADILRPLYDETQGGDGFVSLEVSPELAYDTSATVAAGRRLWKEVGRPNVMIKVPGTEQGVVAVRELLVSGININVTLLFSSVRYAEVARCYVAAFNERLANDPDAAPVFSVASFFVSRVDSLVEKVVSTSGKHIPSALLGKVGIANCRLVYEKFREHFIASDGSLKVVRSNQEIQRPLWASTGIKNDTFDKTMYVSGLMDRHTVNTLPSETLSALTSCAPFKSDSLTDTVSLEEAYETLEAMTAFGMNIEQVASELQKDGVEKFKVSYRDLCQAVGKKRVALTC
jgi:transaldolase